MYRNPAQWAKMMQTCIAMNGSFFNTHRMVGQYVANAYFPETGAGQEADVRMPVLV